MIAKLAVASIALAASVSAANIKRVTCPDGNVTSNEAVCIVSCWSVIMWLIYLLSSAVYSSRSRMICRQISSRVSAVKTPMSLSVWPSTTLSAFPSPVRWKGMVQMVPWSSSKISSLRSLRMRVSMTRLTRSRRSWPVTWLLLVTLFSSQEHLECEFSFYFSFMISWCYIKTNIMRSVQTALVHLSSNSWLVDRMQLFPQRTTRSRCLKVT